MQWRNIIIIWSLYFVPCFAGITFKETYDANFQVHNFTQKHTSFVTLTSAAALHLPSVWNALFTFSLFKAPLLKTHLLTALI